MLNIFTKDIESLIYARNFFRAANWRLWWKATWNGALKPAFDAINVLFDRVLQENPKRFSSGAWSAATTYNRDSIVEMKYTAGVAWSGSVNYAVGNVVDFGAKTYRAISSNTAAPPDVNASDWEDISTTVYFRSRVAGNVNFSPLSNPTKWEIYFPMARRTVTKRFIIDQILATTNGGVVVNDILVNVFKFGDPSVPTSLWLTPIDPKDTLVFYGDRQPYIPDEYLAHFFPTRKYTGTKMDGPSVAITEWQVTQVYAAGDMVVRLTATAAVYWTSKVNANTGNVPETDLSKWTQGFYSGPRPSDGNGFLGNPAVRFANFGTVVPRKWMLTVVVANVGNFVTQIADAVRRNKPALWEYEIVDLATGKTIAGD